MPTAKIWYCDRCRKALRCKPKGAVPRSCKCKAPKLPPIGTLVTWDTPSAPEPRRSA